MCEKMIYRIFLGSFAHKMSIITPIFHNKNEVVQVVNSNMRPLKIYDNTNDMKILSNSINDSAYYVEYLMS
jgi:hypothetical protein